MNSTNFFERLDLFKQNFEVEIKDPGVDNSLYVFICICGAMIIFLYAFTIFYFCYLWQAWGSQTKDLPMRWLQGEHTLATKP